MKSHQIQKIREQYQAGQWPKLLEMLEVDGLRGFTGQAVNFNFPVVAVVGENGSGKSTVLKVAACAYENEATEGTYYPSTFFIDTHWDTIEDVTLSYRIKEGNNNHSFRHRKPSQRWSFPNTRYKRHVYILDIARTLPLDATVGYAKIARQAAGEADTIDLTDDYVTHLSHVLSRDYESARFALPDIDKKKEVGLLTRDFGEISQFHQGAGEDATLDLFRALQIMPDYSLLIIDEVEASLHPKAQRRLIQFLLKLCREKRLQIILSTHSPYILDELPREARILLLPGNQSLEVLYGVSSEFAMSRLDDRVHPELLVFVEDRSAEVMLREIVASHVDGAEILRRLNIVAAGPANVVQVLGQLAHQERLPYKSMAFVDGDTEPPEGTIQLPGDNPPEVVVYGEMRERNWPNLPERFGIGAGDLFNYLEEAMREPDWHTWNSLVGDQVRRSGWSVWETLANEWAKTCLSIEERNRIVEAICHELDQPIR